MDENKTGGVQLLFNEVQVQINADDWWSSMSTMQYHGLEGVIKAY